MGAGGVRRELILQYFLDSLFLALLVSSSLARELGIEVLEPVLLSGASILTHSCDGGKVPEELSRGVAQHPFLIRVLLEVRDILVAHHVVDDLRAPLLATLQEEFGRLSPFDLLISRDGAVA